MRGPTRAWLARPLLAGALVAAGGSAVAASLDEEKLRVLSCDMTEPVRPERHKAVAWLNQSAEKLPRDAGQRLAGPIQLGKACLRNVTVTAGPGALMIQGEICSASLDDFTDALAAAGIRLGKDVAARMPGAVLGMAGEKQQYMITKGMIDMQTGNLVPTSSPYAFMCGVAGDPR